MTDSSQFDDKEKLNVLLKSAFEVTSTNESTPWYNETTVPFNNYVEGNTILIDDIPSNPNFNTVGNPSDYGLNYSDFYGGNDSNNSFGDGNIEIDSTGVLVRFKKLILEPTGTHNRSYYKMGTINNVSVNLLADSFQFTKNLEGTSKPFEYIVHKNDNVGTNKISKDSTGGNYFFDFKSGIVFFPDYNLVQSFVDDTKPPLFTFVRYIGKKGVANLTSDSVKEDTTTIGTTIPAGTKIVISKSDLSNIKKQIIGGNQVYKLGNNSGLPNSEIAIETQNRDTFSDSNGVGIKGYAHVHFNPHIKINNSSQTFTVKITINVANYDSNDSRKLYAGTQGRSLLQDYIGSTEHLEVDDRNTFNYNLANGTTPTAQETYTGTVGDFNPSEPYSGIHTKFDPGSEMITIVFLPNYSASPHNQITYIESIEIESNQDMVTLPRNVGSYGISNDLIFNLENLDGTYREAMRLNQNQNLQVNGNLLANRLLIGGNNTADASYIPTVIGFSHNVTGDYSTAIGYNCSISDSYSMAVGYVNNISNMYGYCFGRQNTITGSYSGCFGRLNEISNTYGFSTGYNNDNSGYCSIAMGLEQTVSGSYSAVIGRLNQSGDNYSFTAGYKNTNGGYMSVAMSRENTITGDYAIVMGRGNTVSNHYSVSFGQNNETTHQFTLSQGYNNKIYGNYTTALGYENESNQQFCFMSGQYLRLNSNDFAASFGRYNVDSADLIFSIGNGTSASERNNAFSVADSGNVGIGTYNPDVQLHIKNTSGGEGGGYNGIVLEGSDGYRKAEIMETPSNNGYFVLQKANNIRTVNIASDGDSYFNGGNVGIGTGTDDPSAKLHIKSNTYNDFIILDRTGYENIDQKIYITPSYNGENNTALHINIGTQIPLASFCEDGTVGIGTPFPVNKLDIKTDYTINYTSAININSSFRDRNIYSIGFNNNNGTGQYQCGMGAIAAIGDDGVTRAFFSSSCNYVLGTHIVSGAEWGIYSSGWTKLFGIEGGSGRAYIKGNVGIGTDDPQAKLDIGGDGNDIYFSSDTNISRNADYDTYYLNYTNSIIRYADSQIKYSGGGAKLNKTHEIELGYDMNSKTTYNETNGSTSYYPTRHAMHFKVAETGDTPLLETRMSIISNGNIGIGTDSPLHKLEISDGLDYPYSSSAHHSANNLAVLNLNISTWAGAIKIVGSHSHSVGIYDAYCTKSNSWSNNTGSTFNRWAHFSKYGDLYFRHYYNSSSTSNNREVLVLKHNGNVGIGTTSPHDTLEIKSNVGAVNTFSIGCRSGYAAGMIGFGYKWTNAYNTSVNLDKIKISPNPGGSNNYYSPCGIMMGYWSSEAVNTFYTAIGFVLGDNNDNSAEPKDKTKMIITRPGNVGIGTTYPKAKLHISGTGGVSSFGTRDVYTIYHANNTMQSHKDDDFYVLNSYWSLLVDDWSWFQDNVYFSSDKRIKQNISDISDNVSLKQLRDISCVSYYYKDKLMKGSEQTIGFIAQQVNSVMPNAINITKGIISNEMRLASDISWNVILYDNSNNIVSERMYDNSGNNIRLEKYKLTINDLNDNSGNTLYRFYVSNDISGNDECKKEIRSLIDEPKSFIFDQYWNNIYIYGKEVNDFHTLDKNKLYALNFSATQEIDRIQQQEKTKLEEAQNKIISLENELASVKSELLTIKQHLGL